MPAVSEKGMNQNLYAAEDSAFQVVNLKGAETLAGQADLNY